MLLGAVEQIDGNPGMFYEVINDSQREVFYVFALIDRGRRIERQLVFTSNNRFSLHYIPSVDDEEAKERADPPSLGSENAAGSLFGVLFDSNNQITERPG
jgi:hypothetical protein